MSTEWTAIQRPNVWTVQRTAGGARVSRAGFVGPAGPAGSPGGLNYDGSIPNPTARTYYLRVRANVAHTLSTIYAIQTTTGTLTASLRIDGTPVTGWDAIAVTTTPQDLTLGSPVTVPVGAVVTWVLSAVSGSPTDFRFSIPGEAI